jgi:hypothetical protein
MDSIKFGYISNMDGNFDGNPNKIGDKNNYHKKL